MLEQIIRSRSFSFTVAAFTLIPAAVHAELLGTTFTSSVLYTINTTTGAASSPRPINLANLDGITTRPSDGTIFGLTNDGSLYTINPATGTPTLVGATGFTFIEGDIAYDSATNFLYGIQEFSTNSYRTVRINPLTGAATVVGTETGVFDMSAGAFAPNGTFYVVDTGTSGNSQLLTLDKTNGAVLTSIAMNVDLGPVAGLAFDPTTGTAYVADGDPGNGLLYNLYTLAPATGILTNIGSTGVPYGFSGLTFTVPEPSGLFCGAAVLSAGLARRRRRAC